MYALVPVVIGGFLAGVLWRSLYTVDLFTIAALFLGAVFVYVLSVVSRFHVPILFFIALGALLLGVVRTEFATQAYESTQRYESGTSIHTLATIVREPDTREDHQVLFVTLDAESVTARVRVPLYPRYTYGEQVLVTGELHMPESFETETGRTFNYPGYLMKDSVHYVLKKPTVETTGGFAGQMLVAKLLALKQAWLANVSLMIPEPSASLAGGVIVGAKQSLGEEWLEAFRNTGIIHIVVLSGYNLTLVANGIIRLAGTLPRVVSFGLGTLGVIGFAVMTGAGATIVRASVMAILGMLATFLNRPYAVLRGLAIAAFLMVLHNPFVLLFDPGFQLSCMATAGLILGAPLFEARLSYITNLLGLRGIVAATFATQLAVLPLLMYQIGAVSLVAPLVNMLILPLVPLVMALGSLVGVIGVVSTALALPLAWLTHSLLSYMFVVVDLFNSFSFAAVSLPVLPWWSLVSLYGFLYLLYVHIHKTAQLDAGR